MIDVEYPNLLENFRDYIEPKRSESASFLIWYLEKYYRLDSQEAIDAVCDQGGDMGVDGVFVNDSDQTITIFQSKISRKANSTVGDAMLRSFLGTLQQFDTEENLNHLVKTCGSAQVGDLITRLDIAKKLQTHSIVGEYIVNLELDSNGQNFLMNYGKIIRFVGKSDLVSSYISDERDAPKHRPAKFDIFGLNTAEHIVDVNIKAVIAPLKTKELVELEGIADQSLFSYNVRNSLGKTKVNQDMIKSVTDKSKHKFFPLFHNGITIIADKVSQDESSIIIEGYYVVNGCQSISSLFMNKTSLTDDLRVLTKIIQMNPTSKEAKMITEYSNNQNGVRPRDFKSNHEIQIRLQKEFVKNYQGKYVFEVKRGELPQVGIKISNEEAGLYLMAFDLREPWATHRKYEIFEDKHGSLFGRREVTADRIVMFSVIAKVIVEKLAKLENRLFAQYVLTRYMLMFVIRECFKDDDFFKKALAEPQRFVRGDFDREKFARCVGIFVDDLIIDLNSESSNFGDDFDYRGRLRDADWVSNMTKLLVKDYLKQKNKGKAPTFEQAWNSLE